MNLTKTTIIVHLVTKIAWAALFVSGLLMVLLGQAEKGAAVFVLGCSIWVATKAINEGIMATHTLINLNKNSDEDDK